MKTDPIAVIISVSKYACPVMMSVMTFPVFITVRVETGYAKEHLENTSIALTVFS